MSLPLDCDVFPFDGRRRFWRPAVPLYSGLVDISLRFVAPGGRTTSDSTYNVGRVMAITTMAKTYQTESNIPTLIVEPVL
ncbi:hypothetical protein NUH87_06190 [Pseudomonas batumici]|uniref:hypothetical protein n=1 Tax=Pseudomonas batumici TaxID=226910 RepID=UPI0030CB2C1F